MNIKIYRGSRQIGGCIVGISTADTRILIDMGTQLPDTKGTLPPDELVIDDSYDAVIFTHYHWDHIGLMEFIAEKIPLYIGETAKKILSLTKGQGEQKSSSLADRIETMKTYRDGQSFSVGDLTITPILTDHSAFDAYMLLIRGDNRTVLHTGDFRMHGIKGPTVLPRLSGLKHQIDVLITEGTNLSFENPITTEELRLAETARTLMERFSYTFVLCSKTDMDRLAVFHKAAEEKSAFYCDTDQMKLLEAVRENGANLSPMYAFERAEIYLPGRADEGQDFCMAVRGEKAFQEILKTYAEKHKEQSLMVYAVSEGHLKKHKNALEKMFGGFRYRVKLHTSGHGSAEAIWSAAQALQPKIIIPIHTENPERIALGSLQNRVIFLEDGASYDIL